MICHWMDYGAAMKSQWKTDIMEVSNNDLHRAARATGEVTESCPSQHKYAQGGNESLELTVLQEEMDFGRRWIMAKQGFLPVMDNT